MRTKSWVAAIVAAIVVGSPVPSAGQRLPRRSTGTACITEVRVAGHGVAVRIA